MVLNMSADAVHEQNVYQKWPQCSRLGGVSVDNHYHM